MSNSCPARATRRNGQAERLHTATRGSAESNVSSCFAASARPHEPPLTGGGSSARYCLVPEKMAVYALAVQPTFQSPLQSPNVRSSGQFVAERYSPQTLRRGNDFCSTMATDSPLSASKIAAADPAGPPPIITASNLSTTSIQGKRQTEQPKKAKSFLVYST